MCDATHWSNANALHIRFEADAVKDEGCSSGYTEMISWSNEVMTPTRRDLFSYPIT